MDAPSRTLETATDLLERNARHRSILALGSTTLLAGSCFFLVAVFSPFLYIVLPTGPYLTAHALLEMASVLVSVSIFLVNVRSFPQRGNANSLFVGAGFLAVGTLDVMHLLSYNGMPEFVTANSVGKAIYYWLAARLVQSTVLFAAAFIPQHRGVWFARRLGLIIAALSVAGLVFVAVSFFPANLPSMYVDGAGLTPVKKALEYGVIALNLLAFAAYIPIYRRRQDAATLMLMSALILVVFSEAAFTLYASAYDTYNLLGHLLKLVAYYLIFHAIFVTAVEHPYHELWRANQELAEAIGRLDRRNRELDVLNTVGHTAVASLNLSQILDSALSQLITLLNRDAGAVFLLDHEQGVLRMVAHERLPEVVARDYLDRPLRLGESIAGRVAASGEAMLATDLLADPRVERPVLQTAGLRSMAGVPIEAQGRTLGVLAIFGTDRESVTEEDLALLANVGNELGLAVANARLYESEQRLLHREKEKTAELYEITRTLTGSVGLPETLLAIARSAQGLLGADLVTVMLLDETRSTLRVEAAVGRDGGNEKGAGAMDSLAHEALRSQKAIAVDNLGSPVAADLVRRDGGFRSVAVAPLTAAGETLGVIQVGHSLPRHYSADDLALLTSFADSASVAIRNASLYDDAVRERHRAETVIAVAPDGLMVVDRGQRVVTVNPALQALTGFHGEELAGTGCRGLFGGGEGGENPVCAGPCPLEEGYVIEERPIEALLSRKGVPPTWVEVRRAPITDGSEAPAGAVYTIRDISQRKAVEVMKDEFISVASHDLKSPITSIKGYAQLAMRRLAPKSLDECRRHLEVVNKQADHMVTLINTLLDVSRIQTGRLELSCKLTDLREAIADAVESVEVTTDRHEIVVEVPAGPVVGYWDHGRLEEMLRNLIGNAVKYSPEGGEVRVALRQSVGEATVIVADHGIGISDDDRQRLFERFYRARTAVAQGLKGTGLGLYISKAIVEAHGGRIWVTSAEGQGSEFSFSLPLDVSRHQ